MALHIINPNKIKSSRTFLYTVLIGFVALTFWAYKFEIQQSVRSKGQIIASTKTQVIQSPDNGIISAINVKEGDSVKKDDILVVLDKERANASFNDAKNKVAALKITLARLQSEVYDKTLTFPKEVLQYKNLIETQKNLYKRRKQAIDEEISSLRNNLKLINKELDMNMPLLKSGDVSKTDILKLQRQIIELEGQITNKKNKYFQDAQALMLKTQEDLAEQQQNLLDKEQLVEHTIITSPSDGIVKNVMFTTIGGVLRQSDEIMQILPNSDLIVEAKILPQDMSYLRKGLEVMIKLDAYDYVIYGGMRGELIYISADALSEKTAQGENIYYKALIKIIGKEFKEKFSKKVQVNPGMTVSLDIITGNRTVITYFLKPILKTLNESMSEK
jgi:adhesin transport system membrane fusion protein